MTTLLWLRQDLRLADNPALLAALDGGGAVIPLFIFAPDEAGQWCPGGASRWWLHHSLAQLGRDLDARGSRLILRAADASLGALLAVARECDASRVVWNRRYEPAIIARDQHIKAMLRAAGLEVESYNSALLHEPWTVTARSGGPFRVFTAFWRHCLSLEPPAEPQPAPSSIPSPGRWPKSHALDSLGLLPATDWAGVIAATWTPGSAAANEQLEQFLRDRFDVYGSDRDRPGTQGTSRLSPYLHFGEIGPREVWHAARRIALARGQHTTWRRSQFLTELGWRDFAYHLLYHFPQTPEQPLRGNYARFPWKHGDSAVAAWQQGRTGFPIVDAGMRELWKTGWMHNRVRMITASFLVKDLLIDWQVGARWFWDTLVDADLASNTLGWQWVAGCGADAAPFFRIFNPLTQSTKFDPDGAYIRRWIPELAQLPNEWLHEPSAAPREVLEAAGVALGTDYPKPIVEHDAARREALLAYASIAAEP